MSLETFILLAFLAPVALSAILGWVFGADTSPWLAAIPIPVLVLLFFVPYGMYLMKYGDGTDMGQASGYLNVIFGCVVAAASLAIGVAAGYLKRLRLRRP